MHDRLPVQPGLGVIAGEIVDRLPDALAYRVDPSEINRRLREQAAVPAAEPGTWTVHYVDLPNRGRIEGMDRADALRLAAELGTKAYAAHARLEPGGLVIISVPERIR